MLCLSASDAEAKRHSCAPRGSKVLTSDKRGRVFWLKKPDGYRSVFGCLYRTGVKHALGDNPHGYDNHIGRVRLASPYVAFMESSISSQAQGEILRGLDLRSGRTVELGSVFNGNCCSDYETVRRFLVTSFGAVVWAHYT